jgi:hypothetical protein
MLHKLHFSLIALAALALVLVVPHVFAQETTQTAVEFTGTITAISQDGLTLTVDSLLVDVSAAETNLVFEVGMVVKVHGTVLEDGTIAATEVSPPDAENPAGDSTTDVSPDDTLELVGALESLDDQNAVVGGMTFDVTGTEIGADVAVGETVKVHASLSEDGTTWLAREIELYVGEDTVGQDTSGDDNSQDNSDDMDGDNSGSDNTGSYNTGACTFKVDEESANLRSGPGTGSAVLGYAFEDQTFSVVEAHSSGAWVKVASSLGDAWIATSTGELHGGCSTLPVSSDAIVTGSSTNSTNEGGDDSSHEVEGESGDDRGQDSVGEHQQEQEQEVEHQTEQQQEDSGQGGSHDNSGPGGGNG